MEAAMETTTDSGPRPAATTSANNKNFKKYNYKTDNKIS